MPLVNKQPFKPNPIPDNLGPDDEVLYHALTNEIFTHHDAYFDRFLYCNSLIWTCSRTGKSGLTYKEALNSERLKPKVKSSSGTNGGSNKNSSSKDDEPAKKKKKKYPYDPKKYAMPVPQGFDPSLLTPTGKIDGRKLKSKRNLQLAEELLSASGYQPKVAGESGGKRGKRKKEDDSPKKKEKEASKKKDEEARKKEEEVRKKEEEAKKKAQQAELAKERELEAKRRKEAAALAKQLERQKKEEERKKAAAFLQNWEKKCDDLERDDLRRLPQPTQVNCEIPEKLFGDSIYIMEAIYNFHDLYDFSQVYAEGLSFDTLEEVLLDKQEGGALGTLLQFLLQVIFKTQPTQDGYGLDDDSTLLPQQDQAHPTSNSKDSKKSENMDVDEDTNEYDHNGIDNGIEHDDDENDENNDKYVNMNDLIGSAIKAAQEVKKNFTKPLPEIEITATNVTEILRLHLLQSGSFPRGRTIYNGWYSSREDPGLWLCMEEPDLMKKLGEVTVYDLEIDERIKILHTLINQLLTFIKSRSYMEAASDQLLELRKSYRKEAADFARWDRENCIKRMQQPKRKTDQAPNGQDEMKNGLNGAMDENGGDLETGENGQVNQNQQNGEEQTDQSLEELERAYQQNKVDYEDYQRERAIRHEQLTDILLDIRTQLRNNQSVYAIHPIGRDRAYRRYWLFQSLPGLFIEQDDEYVGECLVNPTPLESRYKKLFGKDNPLMHTNEADLIRPKTCDVACSTEEPPPPEDGPMLNDPKKAKEEPKVDFVIDEMNYCTGDKTTCYIHGSKRPYQKWWFFHSPESIDRLLECLNKRGYRESELHDVLSAESSIIKPWVGDCPAYKLNRVILEQSGIRRSRRLRTKTGKRRGRNYD